MNKSKHGQKMRLGYIIFVVLMVVEVGEYVVGVGLNSGAIPWLVILAVPGAGLIFYYYMHISQLWRPEE